jgi:phosphoribosyl 1,2-cyclic phosphodiesterase
LTNKNVVRTSGGTPTGFADPTWRHARNGGAVFVNVTFYGVRGSTPCSSSTNGRYGGNTACVALESEGADPIIFDLGTGLRFWGETLPIDGSLRAHALVTHLHWDHVQGLPFFKPTLLPGAQMDIYGPVQEGLTLEEAFGEFMRPPYFPVRIEDLAGDFRFHGLPDGHHVIGDAKVLARSVAHVGPTLGYRVEQEGVSVAYISDHQQPVDGGFDVTEGVLELCDGADLLIHDAQYTRDEFVGKATWGHCTIDYAVHVAKESGAKRLALFHHDPGHDDDTLDALLEQARARAEAVGAGEVLCASEGLCLTLDAPPERAAAR